LEHKISNMGLLTTLTIRNSAIGTLKTDPGELAKQVLAGIEAAHNQCVSVEMPLGGHGDALVVQPPRHADDDTLFVNTGNSVLQLDPTSKEFQAFLKRNPKLAKEYVRRLNRLVRHIQREVKNHV
jgi:hypothetical protein